MSRIELSRPLLLWETQISLECQHSVNIDSYRFVLHEVPSNVKGSGLSRMVILELFTEIPAAHGEAGPDSLAECQHALGGFSSIQVTRPDFSQSAQLCGGLWNMHLCSLPQVTHCE